MDPAPSEPWCRTPSPSAAAAAAPPDEPPAVRSRSKGLRVGPMSRFPDPAFHAFSGVLVLPSSTVPAEASRSTIGASTSGTWSRQMSEP